MRRWGLVLWLLLCGGAAADEAVYLLARIKVEGTDYSQVGLLSSPEIHTVADCEAERRYGQTTGWRVYGHILRTFKGLAYQVEYRCAVSDLHIEPMRLGRMPMLYTYEVSLAQGRVSLRPHDSYSSCLGAVQRQESIGRFCAKSGQALL